MNLNDDQKNDATGGATSEPTDPELLGCESLNVWIDRLRDQSTLIETADKFDTADESVDEGMLTLAAQLWQVGHHVAEGTTSDFESDPSDDSLPQIEGYVLKRIIGRGGMGVVYSAVDPQLSRNVAIKVLPSSVVGTERAQKRFKMEVQVAAQLDHPAIVPIYEYGEYAGGLYYAMKEIDGIDLAVKLATPHSNECGPRIEPADRKYRQWVAEIGKQIADALAHSHEHGVIHRDVKPANILIDRNGAPCLADFGLARINATDPLTLDSDLVGTVLYMSPEQVNGTSGVHESSDIYSIGLTLYELITLEPAINCDSFSSALKQISEGRIQKPSVRTPSLERDLETIILKSIALEPAARYESAAALSEDLQRFLDLMPIKARRATIAIRFNRWVRRNSRWVIGLSCLAILSFLIVFVVAIQSAKRSAVDATTIREQAATLVDVSATELLSRGDVQGAQRSYREAERLAQTEAQRLKQQRRLAAIDHWFPQPNLKRTFEGALLARLSGNQRLVRRDDGSSHGCYLVAEDNSVRKLFATERRIEFAIADSLGTRVAIVICDRTNRNAELKLYDIELDHLSSLATSDWRINRVWFGPENKQLVFTGWDGSIASCDLDNIGLGNHKDSTHRVEFPTSTNGTSWVYAGSISADRRFAAMAINPGKLVAYSVPDLNPVWEEPVQLSGLYVDSTLTMSRTGKWTAMGTDAEGVRLWHTPTQTEHVIKNNIAGRPTSIQFSSDESIMVVGDNHGMVLVWELPKAANQESVISRRGETMRHSSAIKSIRVIENDMLLVNAGDFVQGWRIGDNLPMTPKISMDQVISNVSWDGGSTLKLTATGRNATSEWHCQLPASLSVLHQNKGSLVSINSRDRLIHLIIQDPMRRSFPAPVQNVVSAGRVEEVVTPAVDYANAAILDAKENRLAYVTNADGKVRINVRELGTLIESGPPIEIDFLANRLQLNFDATKWIANDFNEKVVVGNVQTGEIECQLIHPNWIVDAIFVDDNLLASICWDQRLRIWDQRGSELHQFEFDHRPNVLSASGHMMIVAVRDSLYGYAPAENKRTWTQTFFVRHHGELVDRIEISPTQSSWLTCSQSGANRLWTKTGELISEFRCETPVSFATFSTDGHWLATLDEVGNVQLRDAMTGELMAPVLRGRTAVTHLHWSDRGLCLGGNQNSEFWISQLSLPDAWQSSERINAK
ncbi:MAG: WD40 repeat domain-containing serine/threonine-protein kinase [Planctomycetota bacterium]